MVLIFSLITVPSKKYYYLLSSSSSSSTFYYLLLFIGLLFCSPSFPLPTFYVTCLVYTFEYNIVTTKRAVKMLVIVKLKKLLFCSFILPFHLYVEYVTFDGKRSLRSNNFVSIILLRRNENATRTFRCIVVLLFFALLWRHIWCQPSEWVIECLADNLIGLSILWQRGYLLLK